MGNEGWVEGKDGGEKGWGKERVGEAKVERDCAVQKIPLKSSGPGPSLNLREINACVYNLYR